jgi:hypothetical protein
MYRQYENPYKLNKYLCELEAEFDTRFENGESLEDLIDLAEDIATLKERINFAWQDDEYDEMETVTEFIGYNNDMIPCFQTYERYVY